MVKYWKDFTDDEKVMLVTYGLNYAMYVANEDKENYLKKLFEAGGYSKITVKIFHDYTAFLTRAEGMNNIASIDKPDTKKHEAALKNLILNISL